MIRSVRPHRAIEQIHEIRAHLSRTEVYRGYRSVPIALTGVAAIIAAILQPHFVAENSPRRFAAYWVSIALFNLVTAGGAIIGNHLHRSAENERRRSFHVISLFLPSLAAGFSFTAFLVAAYPPGMSLLPGAWCLFFSLGIFASRHHLPHATGWLGIYYLTAGIFLLTLAPANLPFSPYSPWTVGGSFAIGQLLTAAVLYWNLERRDEV